MRKLARRTYIAGSIAFIFIGALHTYVHFGDLTGSQLEERFATMGDIAVNGTVASSWDLFQGVSLLMGFFSITIGVVNLVSLRTAADGRPPVGVCAAALAVLASVITVGVLYLGPMQVYGGMAGLFMFGLPIVDRLLHPVEPNARPVEPEPDHAPAPMAVGAA